MRHVTSVPRGVEKTLVNQCMRAYDRVLTCGTDFGMREGKTESCPSHL